jgi:hypothetical protein
MKTLKIIAFFLAVCILSWGVTRLTSVVMVNSTVDSTSLGATTPSSAAVTTLRINTGVPPGKGFQHVRQLTCTTPAITYGTCSTTINWPTPFVDGLYSAVCTLDSTSGSMVVEETGSKFPTTMIVTVGNYGANVNANVATVNCVGIHD